MLGERHPNTLATRYLRAQVPNDLGRNGEALAEIDAFAPVQADVLGERHPGTLTTRYLRAQVLSNLGRYGEALAEIDAFPPVEAEVRGARHRDTLATRSLRIGAEIAAMRNIDHESALREIINDFTRSIGPSSRLTLIARYRLARLLYQQGSVAAARTEIQDTIADFDRATVAGHVLLRSANALLAMTEGGPVDDTLTI